MDKIELLKKLKALANDERGNEYERINAEEQLQSLMNKYNIDPEDINDDILIRRELYYNQDWEHHLICQTIYKLFPNKEIYRRKRKRSWLWCNMTDAEYLEFQLYYSTYKRDFKKELDLFYTAFIHKNNIFPDKPITNTNPQTLSFEDKLKISRMMNGISTSNIRKEITDGR